MNYGQWTASWSMVGTPRQISVTCGFRNISLQSAAVNAVVIEAAGTAGAAGVFDDTNFSEQMTLEQIYVLQNRAGVLESAILPVNRVGLIAQPTPPINTSVVVAKNTDRAGRQFRGRWAWPGAIILENQVSDVAEIETTTKNFLQGKFDVFHAQLVTTFVPPYLLHSPTNGGLTPAPDPTPITSFDVRTQMGSSRRRIKRYTG